MALILRAEMKGIGSEWLYVLLRNKEYALFRFFYFVLKNLFKFLILMTYLVFVDFVCFSLIK